MSAAVTANVLVHRARHLYCSHPSITRGSNGDWIVAFCAASHREPFFLHPPSDPTFVNLVCRSYDGGETWETPRVAPGYDWYGVETPGIACTSRGEILLNQWRFAWYPLEEARRRWADGERIFVCDALSDPHAHRWRPAQTEEDWESHPFPYARADGGAYVHVSSDGGYTWDVTVPIEIAPYQGAFSPKGPVELANGDLLLALGSQDHDPLGATFVVRSADWGRSWGSPVEVARVPGRIFSEPSLVETQTGRLLVFSREEVTGHVHRSESTDGGRAWSAPEPLPHWGYPAHAIQLAGGQVLVVYGRRKAPYGIRAVVSEDEGLTWGPEMIVRDDLPSDNLGYPSAIEYEPGNLFAVYYGEDGGGVTCIQGSYFTA